MTVRDFLADFVELYGSKRWGLSAYSGNTGIINNYINPIIGDMNIQDVTRRTVDSFIVQLQKMKPVSTTYRNARSEFLPPNTIEKVCKVLHCAFRQAVRWDMVPKNPFDDVLLPKKESIHALSGRLTSLGKRWTTVLMGNYISQLTSPSLAHCVWVRSQD